MNSSEPDVPAQPNHGEKLRTNGLCSSTDVVRETDAVMQDDVDSGNMQSPELHSAPGSTSEIPVDDVKFSTSVATRSNSEDGEPVQNKAINEISLDTASTSRTGDGPVAQACPADSEVSEPASQSEPMEHFINNSDMLKFAEDAGNIGVSGTDIKYPSNNVISAEEKRLVSAFDYRHRSCS